jgi:hypothetical protein
LDHLLSNPRAKRFTQDFARQWLKLGRLDETNPDPLLYPEYRFLLGQGVANETPALLLFRRRELRPPDLRRSSN